MHSDNGNILPENGISTTQISSSELKEFADLLEKISGIHLSDSKHYLIGIRLRKILDEFGFKSTKELTNQLGNPAKRHLKELVLDAMTTNETFWFRDGHPYDYFERQLLPQLLDSKIGKARIWSAACSSGQEPYSLAMLISEAYDKNSALTSKPIEIVASDISQQVIDQCKKGSYDKSEVERGLSDQRLNRYFDQLSDSEWVVKEELKKFISFKIVNLVESLTRLGKFDVVFCRNVLIYFSPEIKREILKKIHTQLVKGGILILGASEGLSSTEDLFEMVQFESGIVYRAIC